MNYKYYNFFLSSKNEKEDESKKERVIEAVWKRFYRYCFPVFNFLVMFIFDPYSYVIFNSDAIVFFLKIVVFFYKYIS